VSGFEVIALHGHLAEVTCVCFAPDGKQIVSGSDDETLRIWDAINGDEIACLKGHTDCITSVSWSGKRIASGMTTPFRPSRNESFNIKLKGSWDETVRVWDSSAGFELVTLRGHFDCIRSVAFCPDGKRVASGSYDNTIRIWDSILGDTHRRHLLYHYMKCSMLNS
jgi:WD40 repeat protein